MGCSKKKLYPLMEEINTPTPSSYLDTHTDLRHSLDDSPPPSLDGRNILHGWGYGLQRR